MKRYFCLLINLALLMLVWTVPLTAETAAEQFDEELVVTATKIPQPISEVPGLVQTIDEETIVEDQNKSVAELLIQEGFTVSTMGGDAFQANIRLDGASAEQTLIMVDGIPIYGGNMDSVDLSYFPVAGVEKIEVVKGPLSALYGSNALGGVVNIIPNLTGERKQHFYLSGGSFGSGRGSLHLSREGWGLVVGGARTDGHRRHGATARYDLAAQIDLYLLEKGYLKFYGGYRVKNAQIPGSELWPGYGIQDDGNIFLNLAGKKELRNSSVEAKISYQSWENYYETLNEDFLVTAEDRHFSTRWGTDLTFRRSRGVHRFLVGLAFNYDTTDSTDTGINRRSGVGLYLQDLWDLHDALLLHAGFRWDRVDQYQSVSPRLGLTLFLTDHFNLGLNYGTAFRVPTMNDLYSNSPWSQGNKALKPEQGDKWELTAHWKGPHGTVTANVFLSHLRDGIVWLDSDGDWIYRPENLEKLKTTGFGLNAAYNWGFLKTSMGYTFVDQRGWDSLRDGFIRDLNYFGQHRLNLKGQADFRKLSINTGCQVVKARRDERFPVGKMPDYLLLSAGLRYQVSTDYSVSFDVENLTDAKYQIHDGYPMPGRNFKLTLNGRY